MSGFTTTGATVISHNMGKLYPDTLVDCINAQPREYCFGAQLPSGLEV